MKINGHFVVLIILLAIVASAVGVAGFGWWRFFSDTDRQISQGKQRQERMLCETNYQALLAACREVSAQVARGELKPGRCWVREHSDPNALRLPALIRGLEPAYVEVTDDGRVVVELFDGPFLSFAAVAYPDSYTGSHDREVELTANLWYSDDGYYKDNIEYMRKIDALIEKGKSRQGSSGSNRPAR
jgi:hypothetical protein